MRRHQDDPALIADMLKEMDAITRFLARGTREDELIEHAVIRSLEVIGEAAGQVSDVLKQKYVAVPWREMKDMRNLLIHHYFGVDVSRVWRVVDDELPKVKCLLLEIQKEL